MRDIVFVVFMILFILIVTLPPSRRALVRRPAQSYSDTASRRGFGGRPFPPDCVRKRLTMTLGRDCSSPSTTNEDGTPIAGSMTENTLHSVRPEWLDVLDDVDGPRLALFDWYSNGDVEPASAPLRWRRATSAGRPSN